MCQSPCFLRDMCAANWNHGGWAIAILLVFLFIEGMDTAFFDFLCRSFFVHGL